MDLECTRPVRRADNGCPGAAMLNVLHVSGSPTSAFHRDLALMYTRSALLPAGMTHQFAVQDVDERWRIGSSLDRLCKPMPLSHFIDTLTSIDLVVPYQFCPRGMSGNRVLFEDVLGLPVVGSSGWVCELATDKAATRIRVAEEGVRVAPAVLIDLQGEKGLHAQLAGIDLPLPLVVKPNREDNSVGVHLVHARDQLADAVEAAAAHDDQVLVEAFIPGREVRVALIETRDGPIHPAMIEYTVSAEHPLRETNDKLALSNDGNPLEQQQRTSVRTVCPARLDESLTDALHEQTRRAHRALNCRDFSLFDFRIHEDTGEPYMLEAGLFWTFGEISIISKMISGGGGDAAAIAEQIWRQAAGRHQGQSVERSDAQSSTALA